jgi:hypothetical protein
VENKGELKKHPKALRRQASPAGRDRNFKAKAAEISERANLKKIKIFYEQSDLEI